MLFRFMIWVQGVWLHCLMPYTVEDSTSMMLLLSLRTVLGLVYYFLIFSISKNDCILWHFHLSHPIFQYMKYLFPPLFSKVDVLLLSCDVCTHSNQHRVLFPSQPYKPTQPFTHIHSSVWGPFWVTTASKKQCFVTFINNHTHFTWDLRHSPNSSRVSQGVLLCHLTYTWYSTPGVWMHYFFPQLRSKQIKFAP